MVVKLIFLTIMAISCVLALPFQIIAHSGRTDSSGGHNCRVGSCAGEYHYHNDGGYPAPSTPTYYDQGISNGKNHALQEEISIRESSKRIAFEEGYSEAIAGKIKSTLFSLPESICSTNFSFDSGTDESYKSAYNTGWLTNCNTIAREVFQASYEEGYTSGQASKPKAVAESPGVENVEYDDSSNDGVLGWALLGLFLGLPILGAIGGSIRDWWNNN